MSILTGDFVRLCRIHGNPTGKMPAGPTAKMAVPPVSREFL
jgi:hypothetical protein